jgi:hypothetical protein
MWWSFQFLCLFCDLAWQWNRKLQDDAPLTHMIELNALEEASPPCILALGLHISSMDSSGRVG